MDQATSKALEGVVVYFEGYTDELSAYKLKQMLCAQGGKVRYIFFTIYNVLESVLRVAVVNMSIVMLLSSCSHYFSKANTTHVVCTNLSMSKYRSLQGAHGKRSIKLVHPDWLRSSCEAGKKLPENQFLISADQVPEALSFSSSSLCFLFHRLTVYCVCVKTLGRIDSFFTRTTTEKDDKPHKRKQVPDLPKHFFFFLSVTSND